MVTCAVPGCSSKKENSQNYTFHTFPKNIEVRQKWLKMTNRGNWTPKKYSTICSKHFEEQCFSYRSAQRVKLRFGSIPTLFMPIVLKPKRKVSSYVYRDISSVPSNPTANNYFLDVLMKQINNKQKKLNIVRTQKKGTYKNVVTLSQVLYCLESLPSLQNNFSTVAESCSNDFLQHLIDRVEKKKLNKYMKQKCDTQLKKFALTLHFYSPRAYSYMRQKFDLCLPHPKALQGWYQSVNCKPGITKEVIKTIKSLAEEKGDLVISLVLDDMCILEQIEFDGFNHHGYVDVGNGIHGDHVEKANEVLVIMAVAINSFWRIPIAYFFGRGFTASQKATLLKQCIDALTDFVKIASIAFDVTPSNVNMAKILGANLSFAFCRPYFFYRGKKYYIILDACHLLKLIRNTFAEHRSFRHDNEIIKYEFIENLCQLPYDIGFHLANEVTKKHIEFMNNQMNVHLAAQLLNNTVATSLEFCKEELKLPFFENCQATAEFIKNVNNIFDIFNSRNLLSRGFKKPLNENNFETIIAECNKVCLYIQNLKYNNNALIESHKKFGFVGFLANTIALKGLYFDFIESGQLKFLPTYKLSKDHLETFFSAIRARGGFNNNPTTRQFTAAYKRLICHEEVNISCKLNCLSLKKISMFNAQRIDIIDTLNTTTGYSAITMPNDDMAIGPTQIDNEDSDFVSSMTLMPEGMESVVKTTVEYLCGHVVKTIAKKIKCVPCLTVLYGEVKEASINYTKDVGSFIYPSLDVYEIGVQSERMFRRNIKGQNLNENIHRKLINDCLVSCKNFFKTLDFHMYDTPALSNHKHLLTKLIIETYLNIRIKYETKLQNISEEIELSI